MIEYMCMSAFGPKRTCRKTQSMSLSGVKRTWLWMSFMSAFDPKRTFCFRHYWTTVQLDLRAGKSDTCLENPFTQAQGGPHESERCNAQGRRVGRPGYPCY